MGQTRPEGFLKVMCVGLLVVLLIINDVCAQNGTNNYDPSFTESLYTYSVLEGESTGALLGSVSATDNDQPGIAVSYSLIEAPDSSLFKINTASGLLTTNNVLDYETKKQYLIFVRAADNGSPSRASVVPVTINIIDANDNVPLFGETSREVNVQENVINAIVVSLNATDADSTPNINFILRNIGSNTDANTFIVQTIGNQARITVNGALDYETKNLYQFLLTTVDGQNSASVFASATITVHVLDVNDKPPVIGSINSTVTVLENVAIGYPLQTIPATDADGTAPNNIIRYNIISTGPNSNLFYIGEKTGQLLVANSLQLDRSINLYTVIVGVSDMGLSPLSSSATVTISIIRNRPPSFNSSSFITSPVNENVPVNSVITSVTATDPHTGVTPQFANLVYSLLPDSRVTNIFQIDSISGTIRTNSSLTFLTDLSFVLGVIATDSGGLTATASVTVPINRNLNNPNFLNLTYTQEIPENFPLGDSVIQLYARDLDANSPWNSLQYTIDNDSLSQQYFKVNDAGILLLTKSLALTGITEFNMIVSLKDKGTPPRSATDKATVKITVTRNILSPIFFYETYRVTIPETQAIGSSIIKVSATDADIKYNKIVYSIEGDQSAVSYFKINLATGEISTNQSLNNIQINSFVIRVAATDDGPVSRRGQALVFVDVVKNFKNPTWVPGLLTTSILENTAVGVSVLTVSATDDDSQPPNNQVEYYITSGGEYFQVNPTTGVISIKVPPYTDTSSVSSYQVTLVARDRGTPSLQSVPINATITVQRNLNAPKWLATPYNFNLNLSASDNDLIKQLTATDVDAAPFNQMSFDIISYPGSSSSLFKFVNGNAATGIVELRVTNGNSSNLDTQTQYYLYVRVQDNGTPSKYDIALVSIYLNRNLNAPSFTTTSKTITITENTPPGDIVSNCLAADNDSGANGQIVYSLVNSIPASTYFQVVENTGNIIVQRDLHQDRSSPYLVVITAQDKGTPPLPALSSCTVTINVNRNLNAPVFVNTPYDRTLNTNVANGATVVTVTATDADSVIPFSNITYEIVRQTVDGAFILNRNTGVLTVNSSLTQSSYTIAVRAYDGGSPPLSAYNVFVVTVNGNMQSPAFQNPGPTDSYTKSFEVLETISVLTNIASVVATDGDSGVAGNVSYFLVGDNQALIYFQVNSVTGAINLRTSLLQDSAKIYTLNIIARDNDPTPRQSTTTATVIVNVYRNQYAPQFNTQNCSRLVDENLGIGQTVTTLTATDSDRINTFETVNYEIIGDGDAPGFVQLANGIVTLKSALSNTVSTALYIRIRAYDNGVPPKSSTTVCTISINKNLNTPVWSGVGINPNSPQYTYTISEDQALYVPFGKLSATDIDSQPPYNSVNFYNSSNQAALEYFRVTPDGDVSAIKNLMLSSSSSYSWTMGLNDRGTPSRNNAVTATVTVNIIRNNNAPVFSSCPPTSPVNILENATVATRLFQLTASDSDTPNTRYGNITVQIISDDMTISYFNLDSQNYVVLNKALTTDNSTRYQLRVQVADQGVPPKSSICVVPIYVNRNINSPIFTQNIYNPKILENQPVASIIQYITALDNDRISPYNQVSYSFGSDLLATKGIDYFTVMTANNIGQVLVLRNLMLDINKGINYKFTVLATDGGGLQGSAIVNVTVIRNTAPRISNLDSNITIYHNISIGSEVYNVDYIDPDTESPFNVNTFSITGESASFSYFQINPNSGAINLIKSLVGSGPDLFIVIVKVCDGGNLCDTKTLYVNVVRNLVAPTFNQINYEVTIYEDTPVLTSILKVQAVDSDLAPPYNKFTYRILDSTVSFNVESDTGNIIVKKPLTGETYSNVTFGIVAEDGGNKASIPVSVRVNIIRDNYSPLFSTTSCNVPIYANIVAGTPVLTVTATDNDTNAQFGTDSIRYRIIGDDKASSFFTINDDKSGQITALNGISSNSADSYKLRIEARDGLQKTDVKVCTITVTRNLNDPYFNPFSYSVRILETHPTGTSVTQVTITDVDPSAPSNQGYFTLAGNTVCAEYFQINDFTGIISPKKDLRLNSLKPQTYTCTVTASDRGVPPRNATNSATVTITVVYNTAPSFDREVYSANITRTTGDNTPLFTYTVTDNDVDSPFNVLSPVFISGGSDAKYFALNQLNQIVIRNTADMALELDTKYEVFITVMDGGNPPLSDTAVVILNVNRNIEAPICTIQSPITINYTQSLGIPIVVLNATDRDTMPPMNTVTYTLVDQGVTSQYILIDTLTGSLSLKRALPSNLTGLLVQVVARDGGFPSLSSTCSIQINIQRDSNTLAFTLPDWRVTIPETTAVNTNIITVTASPRPNIIYSVIGSDTAPTYFNISSINGQVYVLTSLTRDLSKRTLYYLQVKAVKTFEVTTQEATATVTIIVNRNLNGPVLANNSRFETTINDDAYIGTSTIQIIASDADNDPLLYTVQAPTNSSDYFSVSKTTGLIEVAKPLTSIPTKLVQFNVIVSDQSIVDPKSVTATIVIHIVPDQPPIFVNPNTYTKDISFTQPVSSSIFQVSAADRDLKGHIVYESCGLRSAPSYFQVDNSNGSIYVISSLSSDITTTYQLCLIAYDSVRSNNRATATMTISVNRNPNKPVFLQTNYNATVYETASFGTLMFVLNATDADGQNVEYKVSSSTPSSCSSYFNLHPNTGRFTTSGDLYLTRTASDCTFQFTVSDVATPSQSSDVPATGVITFVRNDFQPSIPSAEYTITIDETQTFPVQVFQVNAIDGDAPETNFGQVEYIAIGDDTVSNFFTLNNTSGAVTLYSSLRTDNTLRYNYRIVARDKGQPRLSATTILHINIIRNMFAPIINNNQGRINVTVYEEDSIANPVFQLNYTDQDRAGPQQEVTWSLLPDSAPEKTFFYITQQGQVYISLPLFYDASKKSPYTFTVKATNNDGSGKNGSILCTVYVIRNLYAPRFSQAVYSVTISRAAVVPFTINAQISATDNDTYPKYQVAKFEIVNDGVYSQLFSINQTTSELTQVQSIDQRTENYYKIGIRVLDGGSPKLSGEATVLVNVTRNLYRPEFVNIPGTISLFEDQQPSEVARVTARDNDTQAPYNQIYFTQVTNSAYYDTDSLGRIYLKTRLDVAGSPDNSTIQIHVCDQAPQPLCSLQDAYVVFIVIRNHAPYFLNTPYTNNLQSLSVGDNVINATALDNDTSTRFGQISYDLIGDDGAENKFIIDRNTGRITATNGIAGNQGNVFRIRIRVCDGGNLCSTTVAIVSVSGNQYTPRLDKAIYSQTIPETQPYGDTVITVNVTDTDATAPNNLVECELLNGTANDRSLDCFAVNPTFYLIFAKRSLTESPCNISNQYNFKVRCSDKGTPPLTSTISDVAITVTRNQSPPKWDRPVYSFTIPKNTTINTKVGTIRATDNDALSPFGTLSYSVFGGANGNTYFRLSKTDNNNVDVILSNPVSSTLDLNYQILALVQDSGTPPRQDLTEVNILVNRDLNVPYFTQLLYNFETNEDLFLGVTIGSLLGADIDTDSPWKDYYFRLTSTHPYFAVTTNGNVYAYTDLALDTIYNEIITLTAQIYDGGNPSLNGSQTATITIKVNRNRNCPRFFNLPNTIFINRNTTVASVIYTVQASDNDTSIQYNRTTLHMNNENNMATLFNFDVNTRTVTVLSPLASNTATQYVLIFCARDGYCDPTISTLNVNVVRNLSPPQWSKNNDTITVLEIQDTSVSIYNLNNSASDTDGGTISFEFAPNSRNTSMVHLDTQGDVYLNKQFFTHSEATFQFQLRDEGGLTSSIFTLTVKVIRNKAPQFTNTSTYHKNISKNHVEGTPVFTVTVEDVDSAVMSCQGQSLRIRGKGNAPSFFSINENGIISLNYGANLTMLLVYNFTVLVEVRDGGVPSLSAEALVYITVERNLFSPVLANQSFQVPTTASPGYIITTLTASDRDLIGPEGTVNYEILSGSHIDNITYFNLNKATGVLSLLNNIKLNDIDTFSLTVRVYDLGIPSLDYNAVIDVVILGDNTSLTVQNYSWTIPENVAMETVVGIIQALPNDGTNYSIVGYPPATSFFAINETTGQVFVIRNLTSDTFSNYTLKVKVIRHSHQIVQTAISTVEIKVSKNHYSPVFSSSLYDVSVQETTSIGSTILVVTADDADGDVVEYSLRSNNSFFYIHPISGILTLTTSLVNYNSVNFTFDVYVQDNGMPSKFGVASVAVHIKKTFTNNNCPVNRLQTNLFPPTITPSSDVGFIYENSAIGSRVFNDYTTSKLLRLNIQDPDSSCVSPFDIFVQPESPFKVTQDGYFQVINNTLDYEISTLYSLKVTIIENTAERYSSSVTIIINILNLNDNSPVMKNDKPIVSLPQGEYKSCRVMQLQVTDADFDPIVFELSKVLPSVPSSKFSVSPNGELNFQGIISPGDVYTVYVNATDQGMPSRSTDAFVVVMGNSSFNSIKCETVELSVKQ